MEHLHEPEIDPLDIDRPGYYTPRIEELFFSCEVDVYEGDKWMSYIIDEEFDLNNISSFSLRMKYLQAKDVMELGFARVMPNTPMYQRGSYTITTYRLLDPTYSRVKISQNGVTVFEGHVKNKSELRRILILNEINFADN